MTGWGSRGAGCGGVIMNNSVEATARMAGNLEICDVPCCRWLLHLRSRRLEWHPQGVPKGPCHVARQLGRRILYRC
jgi:hypothetical protein